MSLKNMTTSFAFAASSLTSLDPADLYQMMLNGLICLQHTDSLASKSLVHYAFEEGHSNLVQALLAYVKSTGNHAILNQRDITGSTPLHYAAFCMGDTTVPLVMADLGADPTLVNNQGYAVKLHRQQGIRAYEEGAINARDQQQVHTFFISKRADRAQELPGGILLPSDVSITVNGEDEPLSSEMSAEPDDPLIVYYPHRAPNPMIDRLKQILASLSTDNSI